MSWESFLSDYLVLIWVGLLLVGVIWFQAKIYKFKRRTQLQQAMSKPQIRKLSIELLKGSFVVFLLASLVVFIPAVILNDMDFRDFSPTLLCIFPLVLFALSHLTLEVWTLRTLFKYPFTDEENVPIPQPPLPHYAGKSFDDLSQELNSALKELEK
jgi:preprotein translocase subunit SecY